MVKISALLFFLIIGISAIALGESVVDFRIDSLDIIGNSIYGKNDDLFTIPVIDNYFPVYLSGWQVSNNPEYIYIPQNVILTNTNDDIILCNEIWSESVDENRSICRRISILLLLKEKTYYNSEKTLEALNQLDLEITVEQSDAMLEAESQLFSVRTQPQIDIIRDSSNITVNCKLLNETDYLEAAKEDPNIVYYAKQIKDEARVSDVTCLKVECWIDAPWSIECVLGYHNHEPRSRIVYFNSSESLMHSNKMIMYFLLGYNGQKFTQDEFITVFEELKPQLFISPEPLLIGSFIGGPYYPVFLKIDGEE